MSDTTQTTNPTPSTDAALPLPDEAPANGGAGVDLPTVTAGATDGAEASPVLYDADAAQIVRVQVADAESQLEFDLRAYPLTDDLLREYVQQRDEQRTKLNVPYRELDAIDAEGHKAAKVRAHMVAAEQ